MKLNFLLTGLVAAPALAAPILAAAQGFSQKDQANGKTSDKPNAHITSNFNRLKQMPGMADLLAQATQNGQTEQDVEDDVKNTLASPDMVTMLGDLQKMRARGASIDELVDTAFDSVLEKKREYKDNIANGSAQKCLDSCIRYKTVQCQSRENKFLFGEACKQSFILFQCESSCLHD
jgi:hypothetical protein